MGILITRIPGNVLYIWEKLPRGPWRKSTLFDHPAAKIRSTKTLNGDIIDESSPQWAIKGNKSGLSVSLLSNSWPQTVWENCCAVKAARGDVRGAMGETGHALTCNGTAWSNTVQELAPWRLRRTEMRRRRGCSSYGSGDVARERPHIIGQRPACPLRLSFCEAQAGVFQIQDFTLGLNIEEAHWQIEERSGYDVVLA